MHPVREKASAARGGVMLGQKSSLFIQLPLTRQEEKQT